MRLLPLLMLVPLLVWSEPQTVITVPAGGSIQNAINSAPCGSTITLQAGATWDTSTPYTLSNKNCTAATPITITSSVRNSLPQGRVRLTDAAHMPRLRTTNTDTLFRVDANAGHWILDGLNMSDNVPAGTQRVVSLVNIPTTARNITVQRSLLYPKEAITDPANWNRPLVYGIRAEGSGVLVKWSRIYGLGLRNGLGQSEAKVPISVINGNNVSAIDNFLEGGYISALFTGGGDEPPEHTSTISNPTATSAVFASVANLEKGRYVRFDFAGTGTFTGAPSEGYSDVAATWKFWVMTRTGGSSLVDFDGAGSHRGYHIRFVSTAGGPTYRGRLKKVVGNSYTIVWQYSGVPPAGTYNWTMWAVAEVTSVSGNTVNFAGVGPNRLLQAPDAPGQAAWRKNQVVHDLVVKGNTINIDPAQAVAEWNATKNSPKGCFEFKSGSRITIDGNHFTGHPCTIGVTQHSNEGATPWTKVDNYVITNNFGDWNLDLAHDGSRQFVISSLTDPYNSDEPGHTVVISNNLIKNMIYLLDANGDAPGSTMTITHNTILNNHRSGTFGSRLVNGVGVNHGFVFTDNIAVNNHNGIHCQVSPFTLAQCYPSGVFRNNVVVDNENSSININTWGVNSILSPVVKLVSEVGFVDVTKNDYRLAASSPFKGKGSGGSDPGVNWTQLVTALGFDPAGGVVVQPSPTPTATITPTPSPTASATPQSSPLPIPSPSPSVPTPTPVPTPSNCVMTITAPVLAKWSSGTLVVNLTTPLPQSFTLTVTSDSGQVTVVPREPQSFSNRTSLSAEFKLQSKNKSANITVAGPCGSKVATVVVR